jgi:hypothetical protein
MLTFFRLGDKATEKVLLKTFQSTSKLIMPLDPTAESLQVPPVYMATFTFADAQGDLQLAVEWQPAPADVDGSHFDIISKKWSRLDRDQEACTPIPLVDVAFINLRTSRAWQFHLLAAQVVEEAGLPKSLATFSSSVKIIPSAVKQDATDRPFVQYHSWAPIKKLQLGKSYRFAISSSEFSLELTRFQEYVFPPPAPTTATAPVPNGWRQPTTRQPTISEPRWSVNVYNLEWDLMFAKENAPMKIGTRAQWNPDPHTWFPYDKGPDSPVPKPDDDEMGWCQLLQKLGKIEAVVDGVKKSSA